MALNCAAIPEGLVENELFGHERGAYTGAGARKIGKMELAHRGTIFLDEIGELPLAIQSKLLRVLEEKRFDRVGGTQSIEVDVADHCRDEQGSARRRGGANCSAKIFFSASPACPSRFPRLRDRGNDVLLLADIFLERFRREFRKPALQLTPTSARRSARLSHGRATCANCKTPWSARQFSATAMTSMPLPPACRAPSPGRTNARRDA